MHHVTKLRILAAVATLFLLSDARAAVIGNPTQGNSWSTTSAVSVRANHEHGDRLAVDVINGAGMDFATGLDHDNAPGNMWLGRAQSLGIDDPRFPSVVSPNWIEFAFDQQYAIDTMHIWNYGEGDAGTWAWTALGMKRVVIAYTNVGNGSGFGSDNPADWTTVYSGDLAPYAVGTPTPPRPASDLIDFAGASARYVLIYTPTTDASLVNHMVGNRAENNTDVGLSEVRFEIVPEPASLSLLGLGALALLRQRRA